MSNPQIQAEIEKNELCVSKNCKLRGGLMKCVILAACPCVVPHPTLLGNVSYQGKCYLWYSQISSTYHQEDAQLKCQSITSNSTSLPCVDNPESACTTSGVGRLATFESWADFSAVTSDFDNKSIAGITWIGMQCGPAANEIANLDPYGNCTPSSFLIGSTAWPTAAFVNAPITCDNVTNQLCFNGTWNDWIAVDNNTKAITGYICEAGKNACRNFAVN